MKWNFLFIRFDWQLEAVRELRWFRKRPTSQKRRGKKKGSLFNLVLEPFLLLYQKIEMEKASNGYRFHFKVCEMWKNVILYEIWNLEFVLPFGKHPTSQKKGKKKGSLFNLVLGPFLLSWKRISIANVKMFCHLKGIIFPFGYHSTTFIKVNLCYQAASS